MCRSALQECDLPEYCTGTSEYCPKDLFKMDGISCGQDKVIKSNYFFFYNNYLILRFIIRLIVMEVRAGVIQISAGFFGDHPAKDLTFNVTNKTLTGIKRAIVVTRSQMKRS